MTILIAIILYVIALFAVLLLVGGVRRGDELHASALRSMRSASREPVETPRPERHSSPWSRLSKKPGRVPAEARGSNAASS
jgi:hypothetical protein